MLSPVPKSIRFTNCVVYTPWRIEDSVVFTDKVLQVGGSLKADVELDLSGAIVAPAFIDSHVHMSSSAFKLATIDLQGKSKREVLKHLKTAKPAFSGWVYARGWDESFWSKKQYLKPDEIENQNPVLAVRVDGHIGVLNRKAIELAQSMGINVTTDGIVMEHELTRLVSQITKEFDLSEWLLKAQSECLKLGVTTVCDIESDEFLSYYLRSPPKIRVVFSPIGLTKRAWKTGEVITSKLFIGFTKLFADGSIGARTAAVSLDYRDQIGNPTLFYSDSQLESLYKESLSRGMEVMTHAIGDLAVQQVVRVSRKFQNRRLRIEHNELVLPEELEAQEVNLVCSMQPNFLQWSYPGGLYEKRLGEHILSRNNHFKCLLEQGAVVAFGSDSMPLDPVYGIKLALNAPNPKQRLTLKEAIRCYTYNSAYANHLEAQLGSIEVGKTADLVILDSQSLHVLQTYFEGVKVYSTETI
ncbi:hypothetical protein B9Q13_00735 [Candidatus Marsarchaeota G2 archaeon ECH_B_SAG-G16]|uniref:Amidohydrolase 3 domain-containing protein n=1 Tax=Candidatus Marsarchaeota G2 archaeon ECH_B_SAG-G16 TaxID=1978167 RepID=A0A2R6C4L7_9ARCH|nr:MAG: hypothetical protein B9Q13_00735 [Candidatus Marsarchaeota G2 archaeon ECH_B_SAG-G16]